MLAPPLKGGEDLAGKSGREIANACETTTRQMNVIAAAHFISRGLIKLRERDKKNCQSAHDFLDSPVASEAQPIREE
jgi:aromatic ring-opening dioxygenase catalytic subunit (LigB family)